MCDDTLQSIQAEEGRDFQEYVFSDGRRVKAGTTIGCEMFNPRTKEWELHLFRDIKFSDTPKETDLEEPDKLKEIVKEKIGRIKKKNGNLS